MKKAPTIVLTGGGSGGHITPLLSLARELKRQAPGCRIVYIGLKGDELESRLARRYDDFDENYAVQAGKFRRYHGESVLAHLVDLRTLALNIRDLFRVMNGLVDSRRLLRKINPDAVFSKGGFVAVPVCLAAHRQRIPIITHDSDTVPGLANRIIGRFAKIHTTGMPPENYDYPKETVRFVGIPLDERIKPVTANTQKRYKRQLGLPPESLVLLVGGAGMGARDINDKVVAIAPKLLSRHSKLHILHLAGAKHANRVARAYGEILGGESKRVRVIDFTPEFYLYTGAADLVITRAGATTLAELAVQKKPVIIIPAPYLTGGHQLKNADRFLKQKAAVLVTNDAQPETLLKETSELLENGRARAVLAQNIGKLANTDAAKRISELIIKTAEATAKDAAKKQA